MHDTKERILSASLSLFAREGYEAVSVSDIAGALGMTKAALYKHFRNKRDIFESILRRMELRDAEQAAAQALPEGTAEEMAEAYGKASPDRIVDFAKAMFRYWTEDDFASQFRRMLTLEQFRDPEMGKLYQQYLVSGPLGYVADLFSAIGLSGPQAEAVRLYSPLFLLCSVYDGAEDKAAVLALLDRLLEDERTHLNECRKEG
jgi:AcrR family transcriptional regulator